MLYDDLLDVGKKSEAWQVLETQLSALIRMKEDAELLLGHVKPRVFQFIMEGA